MSLQGRSVIARAAAAVGVLLVAGCNPNPNPELTAPAPLSMQPPPKQIQVQLASFDYEIYFARGAKALTSTQSAGLASFLRTSGIGEGDSVTVEGSGASSLGAAREAAVVAELKRLRIDAVSGTDPKLAADALRVHADHAVATAPTCPDWSKPEPDEPNNTTSSNYGCATAANLAAMIANPADLVKPKENGRADGAVLAQGAELYRSGKLSKSLASSNGYSSTGLSGGTGGSGSGGSGSSQ
jgi:pilus assembly protein CpaD